MFITNFHNELLDSIAVRCIDNDDYTYGHYWVEEPDDDELLDLLDEVEESESEEFAEAFKAAYDNGDSIYILYNELGEFSQPLGIVIDSFEE